jgi:glycosyltransferase involved in cell wall biosynthesis
MTDWSVSRKSGALRIATVIAAYNAERFIAEALDSVAAQCRPTDQIIVVDDGSTDRTAAAASEWQAQHRTFLQLVRQPNQGAAAARNAGITASDADLIALLDADDVWLPHHLQQAEQALLDDPGLVLCFANHQTFDESGVTVPDYLADKAIHDLPFDERAGGQRILRGDVYSSLLEGNYIPPSTSVFRKRAAEQIGFFDPAMLRAEDRDFFLRLSCVGDFACFTQPAAHYRVHDSNMSNPRNELSFQRYGLALILKMEREADKLRLTAAQRERTRAAALYAARVLLYGSSLAGFRSYLRDARAILRSPVWHALLDPRHVLRATLHPSRSAKNRTDLRSPSPPVNSA